MHEWIKLHTALRQSEVYSDPNAKVIFLHFLLTANAQGKGKFSRFATSRELGMNPSTFQSGVDRCKNKYQLCITTNTSKYTEFSILNWSKYQTLDISQNISQTSAGHQRDISQTSLYKEEIKNKNKIIDKSIGSVEPKAQTSKENRKNKCVEHAISEFTRVYKFQPTDKKVRNVAYNLVQRMQTVIKTKLGGDVSEERVMTGITRLFDWISRNESFSNIQKLETIKLKMSIWEANLKGSYAANERQNYSGESEQTPSSTLGGETRDVLRRDRLPNQGQNNVLHSSVSGDATTRTSSSFEGMGQLLQKIKNDGVIETKRPRPDGVGELRLGDSIQNAQGRIEQTDGPARHDDRGIL